MSCTMHNTHTRTGSVTLDTVLKFITGQSKVPPLGLVHKIKLEYDDKLLPTAECCFCIIKLNVKSSHEQVECCTKALHLRVAHWLLTIC